MGADNINGDATQCSRAPASGDGGKIASDNDFVEWEPIGPEMSDEEVLERLKGSARNYTTAEVLAHLRQLP
jgi:hypothetical protein